MTSDDRPASSGAAGGGWEKEVPGIAGRIAFVTGAAGGIGGAVVEGLLAAGARVAATDLPSALVPRPASRLTLLRENDPEERRLQVFPLDVTDPGAVDRAVAAVGEGWGPIDLGVAVAGILGPAVPLLDLDSADWDRLLAVNAGGVFHLLRSLARRMAPRGRGSLVTVTSNAGLVPRVGMGAYGASKAAASLVTRTLGLELAGKGVRCNVVAPGSTRTPMLEAMWQEGGTEERTVRGALEAHRIGIPLGKIATPEEVAAAVLFLLSARASQITLAEMVVDGGATLHG